MMRKKGGVEWQQIFFAIITGILIVVAIFLIRNYVTTGEKLSDCQNNGGRCKQVCHFPNEQILAYNCKETTELCCYDPDSPNTVEPKGDAVSLPTIRSGHKVFVYTQDGKTVDTLPVTLTAGNSYTYYFKAEGDDVGVCYASIMRKEAGGDGEYHPLVQGGEKRIRMSRDDCLGKTNTLNALTFHLEDPSYAQDEFYIQFIVFDKDLTEDAEFFQANGVERGWWGEPRNEYRVADYRKGFSISAFACEEYRTINQCLADSTCLYCPDGRNAEVFGSCLGAGRTDAENNRICAQQCSLPGGIASYGDFVPPTGGLPTKMCIVETYAPDETCSEYDNNKYLCAQQENCVFCTGGAVDGSGDCLNSGTSTAEKDATCADECAPSSQGMEGYFEASQQQCSSRSEEHEEGTCGGLDYYECGVYWNECVWCNPTPGLINPDHPKCIQQLNSGPEQTCDLRCVYPGVDVDYFESLKSCLPSEESLEPNICEDLDYDGCSLYWDQCVWCNPYPFLDPAPSDYPICIEQRASGPEQTCSLDCEGTVYIPEDKVCFPEIS